MQSLDVEPGWIWLANVPEVRQEAELSCGDAAVAMLLQYWGEPITQTDVRRASDVPAERGLTAGFLRDYLRQQGFDAFLLEGTFADLEHEITAGRPLLVGIAKPYTSGAYAHYQVVVGVNPERRLVLLIDPADGALVYSYEGFTQEWAPTRCLTIVASAPVL